MKTEFTATIVAGATNQYWVAATVVKNAVGAIIINHVRNYPLGCCTIPCTHYILFFSLPHGDIQMTTDNFTSAKSAKNIVMNILIDVAVAILIFISNVVL